MRVFYYLVIAGTIYIGVLSLVSFTAKLSRWKALGFYDAADFKRYLSPAPSSWAPGLLILLYLTLLILCASAPQHHSLTKWGRNIGVALMTACIVVSFSRSLYFSLFLFIIMVVILRCYHRRNSPFTLALVILLSAASAIAAFRILSPAAHTIALFHSTSQIRSAQGRLKAARLALLLVREHPLLGIGPGNFPLYSGAAVSGFGDTYFGQSFDLFLNISAEQGLLGLAALLAIYLYGIKGLRKRMHAASDSEVILLAGLVSILFYSFWSTVLWFDLTLAASIYAIFALIVRQQDRKDAADF